jgi:hypothetical protein
VGRVSEVITVGALRHLLAEFHESDVVFLVRDDLCFRPVVSPSMTAFGFAVTLQEGTKV